MKDYKHYLCVFDIETIPDFQSAYNLLNLDINTKYSNQELHKKLEDYHLEITDGKNSFLRQPFHQVVAISCLFVKVEFYGGYQHYSLKDLRSAGELPYKENFEKDLVERFFHIIEHYHQPTLISFNGKMFDLPVLKYRAIKHGITAKSYYTFDSIYKSYDYKYSADKHCDLIDVLSDFGASAKIKLNEVCSVLGLPGKIDVDGSQVLDMFEQGKIKDIRDYCETDVLNTYLVYLKHSLHVGKISVDGYNNAIEDVINFINASHNPVLNKFKEKWFVSHNNTYTKQPDLATFMPFIATNYKRT